MSQVVSGDLAQGMVMSGDLPQVLHCMLSHLPVADVCKVSSLCSTWNELANDNHLWKGLCERDKVSLPDEMVFEPHQWCYYKTVYQKYRETVQKWLTGEGVTPFTKILRTPDGDEFRGECLACYNHYILTRAKLETDHNIYVFNAVTGEYSHQLSGLDGRPYSGIVSKDETMAVAHCRGSGRVCVWKIENGECVHSLEHTNIVRTIALHGTRLAAGVGGETAVVFVWSIESGQLQHQLCCTPIIDVLVMDSQLIAVYNQSADVLQLWDVNTGAHCFTWTKVDHFNQILLDKYTKSVVCIGWDILCIWDTDTGLCRDIFIPMGNYEYTDMVVHGGAVVIANDYMEHGSLFLVDLRELTFTFMEEALPPVVAYKVFSLGEGNALIVTSSGCPTKVCISLWNVKQREFIRTLHKDEHVETRIVGINVSFNKLQFLQKLNAKLSYVTYDFSS